MASISAYQLNFSLVPPSSNDSSNAAAADFDLPGPSVLNEKERIVLNLLAYVNSEKSANAKWSNKVPVRNNFLNAVEGIYSIQLMMMTSCPVV